MDGLSDQLLTGRQSSLTTEKKYFPFVSVLTLNTDLHLIHEEKLNEKNTTEAHNRQIRHQKNSDHFEAASKGEYSLEYLNMAADCFL